MGTERDTSRPDGASFPDGERPAAAAPSAYPVYPGPVTPGHAGYPGPVPRAARPPRPPLTKRMRAVHWIALDCAVAAFLTMAEMLMAVHPGLRAPAPAPGMLFVAAGIFVPVALRRRAPATALGTLLIIAVLVTGMAGFSYGTVLLVFLATAYVLYLVTVTSSRRTAATALALAVTVMLVIAANSARQRGGGAGDYVPVALAMLIAWMIGYSVRQRRLYAQLLQHEAASTAVAQERLRIARELHDVVAHSMSVIAVQAGYGQYVIDVSPDDAREALGAIQATSRDALDEMRRMLGVLRQQDGAAAATDAAGPPPGPARPAGSAGTAAGTGSPWPSRSAAGSRASAGHAASGRPAPLAPAPGLADLGRLAKRTSGAGVRVRLEISGRARPVPAGIDLSAYRIVQEALTNVVRHAGTGASCTVSVGYMDADLVIRVTDDGGPAAAHGGGHAGAPPGTGHGIIGMRERVHLCGGTFGAGPLAGGGFQVTAMLPLPGAAPGAAGGTGTGTTDTTDTTSTTDTAGATDTAGTSSTTDTAGTAAAVGAAGTRVADLGHGGQR